MTPFLQADSARWAIVLLGPASIIAAVMLFWYRAEPMVLDDVREEKNVIGPNYRPMLSSCRVMMPLSYILIGAVGPIMPYRLSDLGVSLFWETPLTSIWLFARVMAVALMWHLRLMWQLRARGAPLRLRQRALAPHPHLLDHHGVAE